MGTNVPRPLLLAVTILSGMGLGACEPKRIEIVKPPIALTTCADEPQAPDLPTREQQAERDRLTLDYILGLRSAWGDCKSKVAGIKAWSEGLD
jgi:hypothetical protein